MRKVFKPFQQNFLLSHSQDAIDETQNEYETNEILALNQQMTEKMLYVQWLIKIRSEKISRKRQISPNPLAKNGVRHNHQA